MKVKYSGAGGEKAVWSVRLSGLGLIFGEVEV